MWFVIFGIIGLIMVSLGVSFEISEEGWWYLVMIIGGYLYLTLEKCTDRIVKALEKINEK